MADGSPVSTLARRLRAGETLFTGWVGIPDAAIPEIFAREGFDTVLLDMQHGSVDIASAIRGVSAVALAGKPALVRIAVGEFATASRMLDAGAAGVVAPMINSVADAKAFASFMKFPPMGDRSWGPTRALGLTGLSMGEYLAKANDFSLCIAMIETRAALDALDGILAVPGIDGVLVGPSDLSIALSGGASVDPNHADVTAGLEHVAARCKAHGKIASAFCHSGAKAKELAAKGYRLLSVANDQLLLRAAARSELAIAKG